MSYDNHLSYAEEDAMQVICSKLAKWQMGKNPGDHLIVENDTLLPRFVVHREIRGKFNKLWTEDHENDVSFITFTFSITLIAFYSVSK